MDQTHLILTCEHGGNKVPREYAQGFTASRKILDSHKGWDPGALAMAKHLSKILTAPLEFGEVTRLLIELNRSENHPDLYSKYTTQLSTDAKSSLKKKIYLPYCKAVEARALRFTAKGEQLLHLSIHSFTPVLRGVRRDCDIGILFDPEHPLETSIAKKLKATLELQFPSKTIRYNYPYKGSGDGLTTTLRHKLPKHLYAGLEFEFNQGWLRRLLRTNAMKPVATKVAAAIQSAIEK